MRWHCYCQNSWTTADTGIWMTADTAEQKSTIQWPGCARKLNNGCHTSAEFNEYYKKLFFGPAVWQYGLWSFQMGYTKLERFLPKNQHTQRKFLNFENWTNREPQQLAKIRVFKVDYFDFSCKKIE